MKKNQIKLILSLILISSSFLFFSLGIQQYRVLTGSRAAGNTFSGPKVTMNRPGDFCAYGPTTGITYKLDWENDQATEAHLSTSADFSTFYKKTGLAGFKTTDMTYNFLMDGKFLVIYPNQKYYLRLYQPNGNPTFSEVTEFTVPECPRPDGGYTPAWTASCGDRKVIDGKELLAPESYQDAFTACGTKLTFGCSPKDKKCSVSEADFTGNKYVVTRDVCTTNKPMNFCWTGIEGVPEVKTDPAAQYYAVDDVGCGKVVQADVWKVEGDNKTLVDYVSYYTGDCAPTATPTPTTPPTDAPTNTPVPPTATPTHSPTPTNTGTPGPTNTPTAVPTASNTPVPTDVPTATPVPPTATQTPIPTNTPIPTATNTPAPTAIPQPTNTPAPTVLVEQPTPTPVKHIAVNDQPPGGVPWLMILGPIAVVLVGLFL